MGPGPGRPHWVIPVNTLESLQPRLCFHSRSTSVFFRLYKQTEATDTPSGHRGVCSFQVFLLLCPNYHGKPDSAISGPPTPPHRLKAN